MVAFFFLTCRVKSAFLSLLALLLLSAIPSLQAQPEMPQAPCTDWQACRDLAEQARAAGDYETYHDLAWRAVQTRGRRDPELFFLLARAQSLSGRPHDAMVTLQRLAQEMHVAKDIGQDEDFRRVRALAGWPEVQAIIEEASGGRSLEAGKAETRSEEPRTSTDRQKLPTEPGGGTLGRNRRAEPSGGTWEEVARFAASSLDVGGLAYDAVSRRFVIGNVPARKLTIVEEGTNRAATLSGNAAQLLNVRALEIDRAQGDLWVVSEGTRDGSEDVTSELHKLQLVSGRVLTIYTAEPSDSPCRFVDVAVRRGNGVLVLDASGPRLLRPARTGRHLVELMKLPDGAVTSLAPAGDGRTVYVAYEDHVARVDLGTHHVDRVAGKPEALAGFTRFRWHKGTLVGAQSRKRKQQIVQLRLGSNGASVVSRRMLDDSEAPSTPLAAVDVLEDDFFYLVPGEAQASIRRIRLR